MRLRKVKHHLANWQQRGFLFGDRLQLQRTVPPASRCRRSRGGVWGSGPLRGLSPPPKLKLSCSFQGKKGGSLESGQEVRVEVMLPPPVLGKAYVRCSKLFAARFPTFEHVVTSPKSQGTISPRILVNGDHRLRQENLCEGTQSL